jgi:hypothetical protein
VTCDSCGASSRPGAAWCARCHRTFEAPPSAPKPSRPVAVVERPSPATYSRWRKSTTSFGPLGRVLCTLAVLAVAGLCLFSEDPFAIGGWCLVAGPLVLRSVWAKAKVG